MSRLPVVTSRLSRRGFALGGAAALTAGTLAACNPGGSTTNEGGGDPVEQQDPSELAGKTLSYLYFTDGPDEQATRDLIAQFEQEYDVTVELEIVPFSDITTTLQARLSGGQAPDVARVAATAPFAGDLLVLDDFLGADYLDEFAEGVRVGMTDADGKIVAIASDLTQNGPFVNTDLFEKAGVEIPESWTWEEMVTLAKQVQEAAGTEFAFAMDKSGHRLSTILSQGGTYLVQEQESSLDPAAATTALQPLVDMINDGTSPKDFWLDSGTKYAGANEVFLAQQAPVYLSGNWQVAQFDANAEFGWRTTANPTLSSGGGFPGGKFMVGFSAGPENQLAATFLQFMNTTESQEAFITASSFMPTRADLTESGVEYPVRNEEMNVFIDDLAETPDEAYAACYSPIFDAAAQEFIKQFAEVVAGSKELTQAMEDLKAGIDTVAEQAG
ncbi:extracellular solute-binding protein [Brachybacterium muris]|uniref:ABC transporter substrate-binding protein n=1 Tax=Brachybacterium muris TaxID=219301 RepID=UPI00223B12C0|nr:extracellular solute-binding protein [Brachybacterium muris]MCT1998216.1 extracellular solute-binding protein [Brachybacterium muris]MCT2260966.1 extracellular solute-binding protein [Brachybacterium muris]